MKNLVGALVPAMALAFSPLLASCRCGGQPQPVSTTAPAEENALVRSLQSLGPHRMEATTIRRTLDEDGSIAQETDEQLVIAWQDWDDFRIRRLVDGKVSEHELVVRGNAYSLGSMGRLAPADSPDPFRERLRMSWDVWDSCLDPFQAVVRLASPVDEIVQGRSAVHYTIALADALGFPTSGQGGALSGAEPPRNAFEPIALSGSVWVDKITGTRLKADVTGTWKDLAADAATHELVFRMARSQIGHLQEIKPPQAETPGVKHGRGAKAAKAGHGGGRAKVRAIRKSRGRPVAP
jgi:hypothetical protein